jgi:hypothetical protein
MTKRWSSTCSDLSKTKRQASKERRRELAELILRISKEEPEAKFDNADDMLKWLNDE